MYCDLGVRHDVLKFGGLLGGLPLPRPLQPSNTTLSLYVPLRRDIELRGMRFLQFVTVGGKRPDQNL